MNSDRAADFQAAPATGPLHLTVTNNSGSREHFYHFLLGILVPFAAHLQRGKITEDRLLLLCSCGPFDAILNELSLPGLMICERVSHARGRSRVGSFPGAAAEDIRGYDFGPVPLEQLVYDAPGICAGIDFLARRLAAPIRAARAEIQPSWIGTPRILLIERGEPDPYYSSGQCYAANPAFRTAGMQRRNIGNHAELVQRLGSAFPGLRDQKLEGMTLAEQIAWFGLADIVIAQHGAALSNILWMRHGASVVEIEADADSPLFSELARLGGLRHARQFQAGGPFGDVPADELLNLVHALANDLAHGSHSPAQVR